MTEKLDGAPLHPFDQYLTSLVEPSNEASAKPSPEVLNDSPEARPMSAKEIAERYGVSDRIIQANIQVVLRAYPWVSLSELKIGSSNKTRYTPLCQRLINEFRSSGLTPDDWVNQVWQTHPELSARYAGTASPTTESHAPAPQPHNLVALPESLSSGNEEPVLDGELVDSDTILDVLRSRRVATDERLSLREQHTRALNVKNAAQLEVLQQILLERQSQHSREQQHKQAQWDAEVTRETLDEFLYKEQRREELLEQLSSLGKPHADIPHQKSA